MNNDLISVLLRLEMLAFFSAYPLIYTLVSSIAGKSKQDTNQNKFIKLLPYAYALTGTLYLGLQLKNLYPDYSIENIRAAFHPALLKLFALLSLLFWIPVLNKRPVISLLHSLVFFFLVAKDIFQNIFQNNIDKGIIRNDMRVFTDSLLVNIASFFFIILIYYLLTYLKKKKDKKQTLLS